MEEEDLHMKLSLGSSEMGLSAHLQSCKAGSTRIFTSNTHSSVVLQVISTVSLAGFVQVQNLPVVVVVVLKYRIAITGKLLMCGHGKGRCMESLFSAQLLLT